jgi:hypothetical protein
MAMCVNLTCEVVGRELHVHSQWISRVLQAHGRRAVESDDFNMIARQLAAHGLKVFGHVCARQITSQTALEDDAASQRGTIGDWLEHEQRLNSQR